MWIDCRQLIEECRYQRKAEGDKFNCSYSFAGMLNADNCYYVEIESDEILDKELTDKPIFTIQWYIWEKGYTGNTILRWFN